MALIKCNECGKEISDTAKNCIHCGNPVDKKIISSECNKEINANIKICPYCGNKIIKNETKIIKKVIKNNKKYYVIGIMFLIIIVVVVILCSVKSNKIDLQKIYDEIGCDSYYCEMASDGSYFSIDSNPSDLDDYSSYIAMEYVENANLALGFTETLYSKMGKTRALDGTLTDSNEKINVSWTYHPDDGFEVMYSLK